MVAVILIFEQSEVHLLQQINQNLAQITYAFQQISNKPNKPALLRAKN